MNGDEDWEVISTYTQQQAVEDGFLVDVNELAKEAGFRIPVHITCGVYALCEVPESLEGCQDFTGRLWDVLMTAMTAYKGKKGQLHSEGRSPEELACELRIVEFQTLFQTENGMEKERLWLVFNDYEGFTIMLPEEY